VSIYAPPGTECDDGIDWTVDDVCSLGTCDGTEVGDCENPVEIDTDPYTHTTTTEGRSSHISFYGTGCGEDGDAGVVDLSGGDVVYEIELSDDETVDVLVTPEASVDVAVFIIDDCQDGEDCLAWADEHGFGGAEDLEFTAEEDGTYYIIVESKDEDGEYTIDINGGTDTDTDSDTDADTDTDSDTDADSDVDADADTDSDSDDTGGGGDDVSCGCRAIGEGSSAAQATLIGALASLLLGG
jgi:hypothetical protein